MNTYGKRKYIIAAIMLLVAFIYIVKLFSLQVVDSSYKLKATHNSRRRVVIYPARGLVYDRHGELLVFNQAAYDLMVTPREVQAFDTTEFCSILDVSKEVLIEELSKARKYSRYRPSVLFKQISAERYAVLQEKLYKYPGFFVQVRTLRKYPKPIAPHILGYVGEVSGSYIQKNPYYKPGDYIGMSGIEATYEKDLRGEKGVSYNLVDVHNRIKGSYKGGRFDSTAVIGNNLFTSLDAGLQEYGEKLMAGKKGSIVAIEPSTGEVLALVSSPSYDPNKMVGRERNKNYALMLKDTKLKPLYNRALMAQYPPGSTFKMAQAMIALQEGVLTPHTKYYCHNGYSVGRFHLGCHHDGPFTLTPSIEHSCNAYYCYVFRSILEASKFEDVKAGFEVWREHVLSLGFGRTLGIDFPNELRGFVPTVKYYDKFTFRGSRWRALPMISLSIGQGELGVTPLQLANYAATIANRGYYFIPHMVKSIEGCGIDNKYREKVYTSIDTTWFKEVIPGMENVFGPEGTAAMSRISGIRMAGKTGTAQNPHGSDHSIFMAFAPIDNPQIAIAVYVENGVWGSRYGAPIASFMIEKYLNDSILPSRKWLEKRMIETDLISNPEFN